MLSQELNNKFISNLAFEKVKVMKSSLVQITKTHNNSQPRNNTKILFSASLKQIYFKGTFACSPSFLFISPFQYCLELDLSPKTAYLAKVYFDIILDKSSYIDGNELPRVSLCCLWMAIKLNQPPNVSECFDAETVCAQADQNLTVEDLLAKEAQIRELLQSKLKFTTPYDYIQPFYQSFPWYAKAQTPLRCLVQLAASINVLRNDSSGDIFYACFIAVCKLKNCKLQPHQSKVLRCQIRRQARVDAISQTIIARYRQILLSERVDQESEGNQG